MVQLTQRPRRPSSSLVTTQHDHNFSYPLVFNLHGSKNPFEILPKILIQTVRVPQLLRFVVCCVKLVILYILYSSLFCYYVYLLVNKADHIA